MRRVQTQTSRTTCLEPSTSWATRSRGRGRGSMRQTPGISPLQEQGFGLPVDGVPVLERVKDEAVAIDLVDDPEWW